ncbi:uncharacterized protein [Aquarana catesbeiana]|uniref:uncharacterized protein n=1 Tax=Aquarana catesbeiana TaxID=8400 RepID=UPI003CCA34ED
MIEKVEKEDKTSFALCSVMGFYPRNITVEILKDRTIMEDSVLSAYHTNEDGTYSVNRTWKIPTDVSPKMLSCSVFHETLSPSVQKDLHLVYRGDIHDITGVVVGCIVGVIILILVVVFLLYYKRKSEYQKIMVKDIESPVWIVGEKTVLKCEAFHCTGAVKVTWVIKLRDGTKHEVSDVGSSDKEQEQPLMSREYQVTKECDSQKMKGHMITKLTFIPSISRHVGSSVSCRIVHQTKSVEKNLGIKSIYAKPTFVEPVQLTLSDQGEVQISVRLQRFYPQEMEVGWFFKREQSEEKIPSEVMKSNSGDTFDLESKCLVSRELFKDPSFKVIVRWKHQSMEESQSHEMSVRDLPWHPKLQKFPIESVFQGEEVLLQCRVSDYFPDALTVKWFERKMDNQDLVEVSSSHKYKIPEISSCRMKNQTFSSTAVLSYKKSDLSEHQVEFICRVEHPSLDTPIQTSIVQNRDTEAPTFILNNIQGPQTWFSGEKVTLYCSASYCMEGTQVIWMVKAAGVTISEIGEDGADVNRDSHQFSGYVAHRERTEVSDKEGLQDVTSSLTFTPSIITHQNISISCKILCDGKVKEKTFQHKHLYAKPQLLDPVKISLCDGGDVLCSLNLQNFYPKHLKLSWRSGEDQLKSKETFEENNNHTYNVCSDCTVPGKLLLDPNFTLHVTWRHKSLEKEQSQVLSWRDPGLSWCPVIEEVLIPHVLIERWNTLQYNITGYFPDNVSVIWYRKEKEAQEYIPLSEDTKYQIPDIQSQRQSDLTYSCTARLLFTPIVADRESEIMCRVSHPSLERSIERGSGPLQVQGKPMTRKPIKASVGSGVVIFSCMLENFYPKHIQVEWCYWSGEKLEQRCPSLENYTPNLHRTFTVNSACTIPENLLHHPDFRVRVTWRHESMDEKEYKEFSIRDKDFPWRPQVEMSVPPLRIGEEATIQCTVTKYFPDAVNVMWLRKDEQSGEMYPVPSDGMYRITNNPLERQSDKLYGYKSCLTFSPSLERDQGVEYICRVEHPSLEQPIETSTGALQVTGKKLLDQANSLKVSENENSVESHKPDLSANTNKTDAGNQETWESRNKECEQTETSMEASPLLHHT